MHTPLIVLEQLTVSFIRHADASEGPVTTVALDTVDWTLHPGQHWAIIGPNGAGKSTLLRVIRGEQRPDQKGGGSVAWWVHGQKETTPLAIRRHIATVTSAMQEHYVRQQWKLSGEELMLTGFFDTPLLYETPTPEQHARALEVARTLDVGHLLDMMVPAMSQGQLRKMLVARAMVSAPSAVVLDEVGEGLDPASRADVLETVNRASAMGASILFASHRLDELPACITHGMLLRSGRIALQGDVQALLAAEAPFEDSVPATAPMPALPPKVAHKGPLMELAGVDVFINRTRVLRDLAWRIMPGENWAVCGGNGAGKSSLLRLLLGDERQAWGGTVRWFGEESPDMGTMRTRLGYVSDKFQATYGHDRYHGTLLEISGEELVWSGFFASVGMWEWQRVTEAQKATALTWMRYMGLADHARQRIRDMSYGRLRRFMLCRAVAPGPELLLLDEPCSGLDPAARDHFLDMLGQLARAGMQIVYVTHYREELIPEISHVLTLQEGTITDCGPREAR